MSAIKNSSHRYVEHYGTATALPFSPAVRAGNLIFVSGQASVDASGAIVHDTFENEMRRTMDNLVAVLGLAGASLRDVVQVRSYVDDPAHLPIYNNLYREYFPAPQPARTTLLRCLGGVIKFEIDVTAVVSATSVEAQAID